MTREEEIKQAAYSQYCNSESICFTLMCDSFKQGAKWADKNPINIWHDASEEPKEDGWILVQFGTDTYDTLALPRDLDVWRDFVKMHHFVRWAYISDLLPKGGEK